jgi:hypothetical protein
MNSADFNNDTATLLKQCFASSLCHCHWILLIKIMTFRGILWNLETLN